MANLLQEDIRKSAKKLNYVHRRLRDTIGKINTGSPFDELVVTNKFNLCLECKMLRERKSGKPKSFPLSGLSETQREGLLEWDTKEVNKCYVLINFRWTDESTKGSLFALTINEILEIEQKLDRKSIPLEVFQEVAVNIPRLDSGWNLEWL